MAIYLNWRGEASEVPFAGTDTPETDAELRLEARTRLTLLNACRDYEAAARFWAWHPTPPDALAWRARLVGAGAELVAVADWLEADTVGGVLTPSLCEALVAGDFIQLEVRDSRDDAQLVESVDDARQFSVGFLGFGGSDGAHMVQFERSRLYWRRK